jgi:tetratricopeptide (TPR) repeat protein
MLLNSYLVLLEEVNMKKLLFIFFAIFIFALCGCSKKVIVVQPSGEKSSSSEGEMTFNDNTTASTHHLQQAKMFYARDKFKQALQHCEKAIHFDSRNWEAYYYLGLSMQKRKEYARSIEPLNSGLKLSPDNKLIKAELHCAMGISWENLGQYEEAHKQYDSALENNPNSDVARKGKNRLKVEKTLKNWGKDKEIEYEG